MAQHDIDLIDAFRRWHSIEHGAAVSGLNSIDPRAKQLFTAMESMMDAYDAADEAAESMGSDSPEFEERASNLAAALDEVIVTALSSRSLLRAIHHAKAPTFTASADAATEGVGAASPTFRLPSSIGDDVPVYVDAQGNIRPVHGGGGGSGGQQPSGGYRVDLRALQGGAQPTVLVRRGGGAVVPAPKAPQIVVIKKKRKGLAALFNKKPKYKVVTLDR